MYAEPDRQHPSKAAQAGREAIHEALQHHMDRLASNRTRSAFQPSMQPSSVSTRQAHQAHGAMNNHTYFTPGQEKQAGHMYRRNASPLTRLGNRVEGVLGLRGVGKEVASTFNPTTKAGLINAASMFAGGPKGEGGFRGSPRDSFATIKMLRKLGVKGEFGPYGLPKAAAEGAMSSDTMPSRVRIGRDVGPIKGFPKESQALYARSLAERAQGVGGYRPANGGDVIMQRIEAMRKLQSQRLKDSDTEKSFSNSLNGTFKRNAVLGQMERAFRSPSGGKLGRYMSDDTPNGTLANDTQSYDFRDRNQLLNLSKNNPDNEFLPHGAELDPIKQALYDMLFGGKGLTRKPPRPGGSMGGGPLG